MDLFSDFKEEKIIQILPNDGEVNYYGKIYKNITSDFYFSRLYETLEWKADEAIIFGKKIVTARKVAWYGDGNYEYTYSKVTKQALLWTKELLEIKQIVQEKTGSTYNSCLCNLYHSGKEGMAYHSDDEKMLEEGHSIASVSFGAERRFLLRHKQDKTTIGINLANGSLLEMKGETQKNWLHKLATTTKIDTPRVNLTFRKIRT
jgi:alkylated DNA repair dioxygenase AlkB